MPEDLDNPEIDTPSDGPKQLREALKRAEERAAAAEQRAEDLARDQAFRAAGVDPTNPLHAAAMKGYDGETAGIGDWVAQIGLTVRPEQPPAVPDTERERLERIFNASAGDQEAAVPSPSVDKDNELRAITETARREGWTKSRYQDEMRACVAKYGGPVAQMPYEMI